MEKREKRPYEAPTMETAAYEPYDLRPDPLEDPGLRGGAAGGLKAPNPAE